MCKPRSAELLLPRFFHCSAAANPSPCLHEVSERQAQAACMGTWMELHWLRGDAIVGEVGGRALERLFNASAGAGEELGEAGAAGPLRAAD